MPWGTRVQLDPEGLQPLWAAVRRGWAHYLHYPTSTTMTLIFN